MSLDWLPQEPGPRPPRFERVGRLTGGCLRPGGLELTRELLALGAAHGPQPLGPVLDLGCGQGRSLRVLGHELGIACLGLDQSRTMAEESRVHASVPVLQAEARRVPLGTRSCGGVLCECVLSLAPAANKVANEVVDEIARVLRPGGVLMVSDLYARRHSKEPVTAPDGTHCCLDGALPEEQWRGLVESSGLNVKLWRDCSPALARLAAELIFAHGSLQDFWQALLPPGRACQAELRAKAVRPGYFFMIAKKR
ncbi:MAG: class I SAM-dependent methyltransferase [Desulfovibrio sp.]|nr:MAG: class I SAM-dependent methyltransferase [Desulfovibrio sp.]